MITRFYLPLLKSKAGEFTALSNLTAAHKKRIVPLFDITKVEFDHEDGTKPKTTEDHLLGFCKKVIKCWPRNEMFIDTNLIDDQEVKGKTPLEFIYEVLATKNITPMPVVHACATEEQLDTIDLLTVLYAINNIAIRVTVDDVYSPSFNDDINNILRTLKLTPEECHIIFDLKDSDFSQTDDFADGIIDVLEEFPHLGDWFSFTIAGGAFPTISKIKTSPELVPRDDWKLYNTIRRKLARKDFNRAINFGDYSIVSPGYFEFNPKIMSTSANIRYTHNDEWYVVKGRALKKSIDWQQFYDQAKQIVRSSYYLGEAFSVGDAHLKQCAAKKTTTGNANTWIAVGTNHHFTKVIVDLFSRTP